MPRSVHSRFLWRSYAERNDPASISVMQEQIVGRAVGRLGLESRGARELLRQARALIDP
jgi:hypothetical protein